MFDDLQSILTAILVVGIVVYCVMPLILFAVSAVLIRRFLNNLNNPDVDHLLRRFDAMRTAEPQADEEALVARINRGQALRCGVVGAITGFGGFITLPITLPVDVIASLRIQAATVEFIAQVYGHTNPSATELRIRRQLIMSGGASVTRRTSTVLMRFMERSLAKFIPLLGALIGFAVNYAIALGGGSLAQRWYASQSPLLDEGYDDEYDLLPE